LYWLWFWRLHITLGIRRALRNNSATLGTHLVAGAWSKILPERVLDGHTHRADQLALERVQLTRGQLRLQQTQLCGQATRFGAAHLPWRTPCRQTVKNGAKRGAIFHSLLLQSLFQTRIIAI